MLGDLQDNATTWARSKVRMSVQASADVEAVIEDHSPGVVEDLFDRLGKWGVRLDQKTYDHDVELVIA